MDSVRQGDIAILTAGKKKKRGVAVMLTTPANL